MGVLVGPIIRFLDTIVTGIKLPRENHDLDRFMVNLCLVSTKLAIWISFSFFKGKEK